MNVQQYLFHIDKQNAAGQLNSSLQVTMPYMHSVTLPDWLGHSTYYNSCYITEGHGYLYHKIYTKNRNYLIYKLYGPKWDRTFLGCGLTYVNHSQHMPRVWFGIHKSQPNYTLGTVWLRFTYAKPYLRYSLAWGNGFACYTGLDVPYPSVIVCSYTGQRYQRSLASVVLLLI